MPKNTGRGSRGAREAAAASHGRIPAGAFALRGQSVGVFREQRLLGGLFGGSRSRIIHIMVWKGGER